MITALILAVGLSTTLPAADRWWSRVSFLASDEMKGRDAASPEYRRAADWVAGQMKDAGLKPAGDRGTYLQRVGLTKRWVVEKESRVIISRDGKPEALEFGRDVIVSPASPARTAKAEIVFVGMGLRVPEIGHDDFGDADLKGKIVLYFSGAPKNLTGALLAHSRNSRERSRVFEELGVAGTIAITVDSDVSWERTAAQRGLPSMILDKDPDAPRAPRLAIGMNPLFAAELAKRSPRFREAVKALAESGQIAPVPLGLELEAEISVKTESAESWNVVGMIPGRNRGEAVAVTSHLDHLGVNPSLKGDTLFNGAMDNASGVAALLEVADVMGRGKKPKRSIVFAAVTAEEKGLLGSRWLAAHTPRGVAIVADLNMDMFMPLFPLKRLAAIGMEESDLRGDVEAVAARFGIGAEVDPEPERNRFTRSDQYSFIRRGIPSLAFKFGYDKDSPEAKITADWNKTRYHAPSDDLSQPVDKQGAVNFCRVLTALVERVANREQRPRWNDQSFFKRFASAGQ